MPGVPSATNSAMHGTAAPVSSEHTAVATLHALGTAPRAACSVYCAMTLHTPYRVTHCGPCLHSCRSLPRLPRPPCWQPHAHTGQAEGWRWGCCWWQWLRGWGGAKGSQGLQGHRPPVCCRQLNTQVRPCCACVRHHSRSQLRRHVHWAAGWHVRCTTAN
jgi:hypothetical protein